MEHDDAECQLAQGLSRATMYLNFSCLKNDKHPHETLLKLH